LIPGFLVTILTFPGIIVHELAHELVCRLLGVRVLKVCYLRFGNPPGYVVHESPEGVIGHIMIGTGPLLINSIFGLALGLIYRLASVRGTTAGYIILWLGISVAMHSFPSTGDAKSMWRGLWGKGMPIIGRVLSVPLVTLIYLGALASAFWIDAVYGFLIAFYLPKLIVR
jgi:hypothetical protein